MGKVDDYQRLKERLETLQRSHDRDCGRLEQLESELREAGYTDLEDAERQLQREEQELARKERKLQTRIEQFEERYADHLR